MRYRSLENEYAKLDLGLLLKPHSMTKIGNINGNEIHSTSSSKYNILLSSTALEKLSYILLYDLLDFSESRVLHFPTPNDHVILI